MKVFTVEQVVCDEYGCMSTNGVFATRESAVAWAEARGLQSEDMGEQWNARYDYYQIEEWEVM